VDDDRAILEYIQLALEDAGYAVVVATDGAAALEAVGRHQPGLILLDMRMPAMNGWEFAEAYRRGHSQPAPILMMTAGHDASAKAAEIGAVEWLGKPFDVDQLLDAVGRLVDPPATSSPPG
jgi:DNA-binding response OmpR family regulator